jgi:predicted ATP-dependent serine protease
VIWVSAEDDSNVVTANRLRAAGADLSMVYDLSEISGTAFTLPEHIPALAEAVRTVQARLVILDPLAGVAPVSLSSVTKVRGILTPVRDMARATGAAVLITHHLTKDGKISGSPAVIDGVRSVLTVQRDKQDPQVRTVSVFKSNMGADAPVVRYKITTDDDGGNAHVQYVSEDELAQPQSGQDKILAVLTAEPQSGQAIAVATGIEYATVRVLMSRMIAAGRAASPSRGWFTLPAGSAVTTAGQGVTGASAVAAAASS